MDFGRLGEALRSYSVLSMVPVVLFAAGKYILMGFRLSGLLPGRPPFSTGIQAVLLATGMNCVLPAKAGDALKILYIRGVTGQTLTAITSAVVWERLFDCLFLGGMLVVSWALLRDTTVSLSLTAPTVLAVATLAAFFAMRRWSSFFHGLYGKYLPAGIAGPLGRLHAHLVDEVSLPWLGRGFFWSLINWTSYYFCYYSTVNVMGGLGLSPANTLVCFAMAVVGTAVPSLPGGIGLFEGAMVLSLSWFGVDATTALGLALFFHAVHFIPLVLPAIWINGRARYWREKDGESPIS